jgi:hypothetical protein
MSDLRSADRAAIFQTTHQLEVLVAMLGNRSYTMEQCIRTAQCARDALKAVNEQVNPELMAHLKETVEV